MKRAWMGLWLLWLVLLVGCEHLGLAAPQTFNQRLAVGYSSVTAVRSTTLTLLQAKKISAADAANVQRQADNVREALDIARGMQDVNLAGAQDKLSAAILALSALQRYLTAKGG